MPLSMADSIRLYVLGQHAHSSGFGWKTDFSIMGPTFKRFKGRGNAAVFRRNYPSRMKHKYDTFRQRSVLCTK